MALTNIEIETMSLIKAACKTYIEKASRVKKIKAFSSMTDLEQFASNVDIDTVVDTDESYVLIYYDK